MPISGPMFQGNAPTVQAGRSNAAQFERGEAQRWGSLASRLKQFTAQEENRLDVMVAKEGKEQGRMDTQGRTELTLRNGDTIADEAWNEGAISSYVAAVDLDLKENLTRIELESSGDSVAYLSKAKAYSASLIDGADDRLKPVIEDSVAKSILNGKLRIDAQTRTDLRKEQSDTLELSYETSLQDAVALATEGDYPSMFDSITKAESAIQSRLDAGFIDKVKAAELMEELEEDTDSAVVFGEFDKARKDGNGDEYLTKFMDKPPSELTPESVQKLSAVMDRTMARDARISKRLSAESDKAAAANKSRQAADLKLALSRGQAGEPEIELARQNGVITDDQATNHIISLDKQLKKEEKKAANAKTVAAAITAGAPLSPSNKDHVDGVNDLWESAYAPDIDITTDDGKNIAADYVEATGIVPTQIKDYIHAHSKSGDVDQSVNASDLLARINEKSPQSLEGVTKNAKAFALSASNMVAAGTDPATAVAMARSNAYEVSKEEMQAIKDRTGMGKTDFRDATRTFLDGKIDDDFDPFFFTGQPELPIAMEAEFNNVMGEYIGMTKDAGEARQLAWSDLKKVWGMTQVNGRPEMMKYAPETIYGNGGGSDWIRDQLIKDVKNMGAKGEPMIAVDPRTAREKHPSYIVVIDGQPLLGADNQPAKWIPDYKTSKQGRQSMKELDANVEADKVERTRRQTRRELSSGESDLPMTTGLMGFSQ